MCMAYEYQGEEDGSRSDRKFRAIETAVQAATTAIRQ